MTRSRRLLVAFVGDVVNSRVCARYNDASSDNNSHNPPILHVAGFCLQT